MTIKMVTKRGWILLWILQLVHAQNLTQNERGLFAPRMDYDQWKPLGRGDPLKNDPTYDYVPPVLDRVHYWIDPALRKPDPPLPGENNQKTEILLLGVSSKKPTIADSRKDNYDSFLKFVDGPKFSNSRNRPHFPPNYFFPKNKNEQRTPYTMLMPPPMITRPAPSTDPTITSTLPSTEPSTEGVTIQPANLIYHSSSWKTTAFSSPRRNATASELTMNYVTPPPLQEQEIMRKGQVSDDNLDISNTYVKIGKTEAQVQPAIEMLPAVAPLTMQTLQNMQSMQPPPITTSPIYKKSTFPIQETTETPTTTIPTTTLTTALTTDPLFKHYKQPTEPLKGPLYLIIQGHSKVKTYGPSREFHGIRVQESNEIEANSREARAGKLQTLKHVIETRLGAIDFSKLAERKEAEVGFGYQVGEDVTSEKYHKGIVEEARKLQLEEKNL